MTTAPTVTFSPASPRPAMDGIVVTVDGVVPVNSHIRINDATPRTRAVSPVFKIGQSPKWLTDEVERLWITGATGGQSFTLTVEDPSYNSYTSDPVYYPASDPGYDYPDVDALAQALLTALPRGSTVEVTKTGGYRDIRFGGAVGGGDLGVTANVSRIPGATAHLVEQVKGGQTLYDRGTYRFGPLYLEAATYSIDLIANAADASLGIAVGDSLLSAPVAMVVSS